MRYSYQEAGVVAQMFKVKIETEVPDTQVVICGSLRRLAASVSDIDVIIQSVWPATVGTKVEKILDPCIRGKEVKFDGFFKGVKINVRIIKEVESLPASILYFTGPSEMNINMRRTAKTKGYKLNEYGLWDGKNNIGTESERQIFETLGLKYVFPENRTDECVPNPYLEEDNQ